MAVVVGRRPRVSLQDAIVGARFLCSLPRFLRNPMTVDEARATLQRRLENRDADFLALVKQTIYEHPSPYRQLLRLAGCEYGDLERLVGHEGAEGALRILLRQGVYLTVDEFKGRKQAIWGSATIAVDPAQLRGPGSASNVALLSGGSRGAPTPVLLDLACLRDQGVNKCLILDV